MTKDEIISGNEVVWSDEFIEFLENNGIDTSEITIEEEVAE